MIRQSKPVITPEFNKWGDLQIGYRVTWERYDATFTYRDKGARTPKEAWNNSKDYFSILGCKVVPEGIENNETV